MMQFLIAAPRSGSGKTTVTCALLAALKKRGMDPCAFKSGPDYIDPMFHRSVLGVESHNLDLYLSAKNTVRELYAHYAAGHEAVVCEGAMGFYDGQGLTTRASAWELADALDLPVLLVVQPKGASVTLAAEIQGLVHFKPESHIAGILLNDCSEKLFRMLKPLLETETGLPVLGYLPRLPQAVVESRHLGLKTAGEITDLAQKIGLLADALEANLDWATLEALTERPAPAPVPPPALQTAGVRIAVAQDKAFCFAYAETLDCLRTAGAELVFFSPVHDTTLPEDICGLYLPGGYPELYARPLSENTHRPDAGAEVAHRDAEIADRDEQTAGTGWESEREVFLQVDSVAAGLQPAGGSQVDSAAFGDRCGGTGGMVWRGGDPQPVPLIPAVAGLAAAGTLLDEDEDAEEKRRRMEAKIAAENFGAVVGLAAGAALAVKEKLDEQAVQEKQQQTMGGL